MIGIVQDAKRTVSFSIPSTADGRLLLPRVGELIEHQKKIWKVSTILWDYELMRVDVLVKALEYLESPWPTAR